MEQLTNYIAQDGEEGKIAGLTDQTDSYKVRVAAPGMT